MSSREPKDADDPTPEHGYHRSVVRTRSSTRPSRVLATWVALLALLLTVLASSPSFARPTLGHAPQALSDLPRLRAQAGARSLRASDRDLAAKLGFTPQRSTEGEHAAEHEGVGEVAAAKRRPVGAPLSLLSSRRGALIGATKVSGPTTQGEWYGHDPDGHRIARVVSSTTANVTTFPDEEYFAWTGGNVVARLEKTGAVRQGFLFEGIDKPLRLRDAASNLKYYYELDIAGNVRRLRRTDGSDAGGYRYSGFGVQYPADQQTPIAQVDQPLRWKGRWWSDFAKIYDVRARQWSPELGSFTSIDEFRFQNPLGTLWSWPTENPIRYSDPSGHFVVVVEVAIVAIAAVAILASYEATASQSHPANLPSHPHIGDDAFVDPVAGTPAPVPGVRPQTTIPPIVANTSDDDRSGVRPIPGTGQDVDAKVRECNARGQKLYDGLIAKGVDPCEAAAYLQKFLQRCLDGTWDDPLGGAPKPGGSGASDEGSPPDSVPPPSGMRPK